MNNITTKKHVIGVVDLDYRYYFPANRTNIIKALESMGFEIVMDGSLQFWIVAIETEGKK